MECFWWKPRVGAGNGSAEMRTKVMQELESGGNGLCKVQNWGFTRRQLEGPDRSVWY